MLPSPVRLVVGSQDAVGLLEEDGGSLGRGGLPVKDAVGDVLEVGVDLRDAGGIGGGVSPQ